MSGKSEEYTGPESNPLYDGETEFETFEDIGFDSHEDEEFEEEEEVEGKAKVTPAPTDKPKKSSKTDKNELEILDTIEEEEEDDKSKSKKDEPKKEDEEEEEEEPKKDEDTPKASDTPKGKPVYVAIDGETFAMDSESLVTVPIDGKKEKVPLSALIKDYSGKVAWDKRFNEINQKNQEYQKSVKALEQEKSHISGVKEKILNIIKDPSQNPKEAFRIFLDSVGVDSYDLEERAFTHDLEELYKVLTMSEEGRKAYYLEKKNKYLADKATKRDEELARTQKANSYRQQLDTLRTSYGVSEADYVDSYEELLSFGHEAKDLSEKEIVEWAATKPHRTEVRKLLEPYADKMSDETFVDLQWNLSVALMQKKGTLEGIKKDLETVYGKSAQVEEIKSKLKQVGRPKSAPAKVAAKAYEFESFDDLD